MIISLVVVVLSGTTIVLVFHSVAQIEQICDRSIWIHEGLVRMEGPAKQVDDAYLAFMEERRLAQEGVLG